MLSACAGFVLIGAGGSFLLLGLFMARETIVLLRRGIRAKATVVDLAPGFRGAIYPVVQFVDQSGAVRCAKLSVSGGAERRGTVMTVAYDAENTSNLIGLTFVQSWLFPSACFFFGGAGMVSGFAGLFGHLPIK